MEQGGVEAPERVGRALHDGAFGIGRQGGRQARFPVDAVAPFAHAGDALVKSLGAVQGCEVRILRDVFEIEETECNRLIERVQGFLALALERQRAGQIVVPEFIGGAGLEPFAAGHLHGDIIARLMGRVHQRQQAHVPRVQGRHLKDRRGTEHVAGKQHAEQRRQDAAEETCTIRCHGSNGRPRRRRSLPGRRAV